MKRIFNLILIALCVISYTSCTNDEGIEYIRESKIKIISRDVSFPAAASQGTIVVEAPGAISVTTTDKGWCTTSVSGSTIQVNVEENPGLEGRNSMLTIHCGNDSTSIAIQQSGVTFHLSAGTNIMVDDDADTYSYDLKCNTDIKLTSSEDWITVNFEEGKLNITLEENSTGHLRTGSIAYTAGAFQDKIIVTQCEFDKDLAGDYHLLFTDPQDEKVKYYNATLSRTENNYNLALPDLELSIPLVYNPNTGIVSFKAGQYLGDYGKYKVFTTIWDINSTYLTWSTAVSMSATFQYEVLDGKEYTLAFFEDDGSWSTDHADALRLEAFSSTSLSSDTRIGALAILVSPILRKEHGQTQVATYRMAGDAVKANLNLSLK